MLWMHPTACFTQNYTNNFGTPYIETIEIKEYGFSNKNADLILDNKGLVFIANENNLLQFDGKYWKELATNGTPSIAQGENGEIYIGGNGFFGTLKKDEFGKNLISFLHKDETDSLKIGNIKSIVTGKDEVIFSNENTLFLYKENEISILYSNDNEVNIFKVRHDIYVQAIGIGLFAFSNGKIHKLPETKGFSQHKLLKILYYNKFLLVREQDSKNFLLYNYNNKIPYQTDADKYIEQHQFTDAVVLKNKNIAVGTKTGGIVFINRSGKTIMTLGINEGLFSSEVKKLFADDYDNLWILHNDGISRFNTHSPFSYFGTHNGLYGTVNDILRDEDNICIATSEGVFQLKNNQISKIEGISGEVYKLKSIFSSIFAHTNKGIYRIQNNKGSKILDRYHSVMASKKHPFKAIMSRENALDIMRFNNENLTAEKTYPNLGFNISQISEDKDGDFWLLDFQNNLYYVPSEVMLNHKGKVDFKKFKKVHPVFKWVVMENTLSEGLFFSTDQGIYRFNKFSRKFYQDSLLKVNQTYKDAWVSPLKEDKRGNIWMYVVSKKGNSAELVLSKKFDGVRHLSTIKEDVFKGKAIKSIMIDKGGILWFGSVNRLMRLDTNLVNSYSKNYSTILNKASFDDGSIEFNQGYYENKEAQDFAIPYSKNKVKFEFSATDYEHKNTLTYSYRLDGFEKEWNSWKPYTYVEYTNLPKGSYKFSVKAKNIRNEETEPVYFSFSIKAPLYKSFYAYIVYGILTGLFVLLIIQWRALGHAKEKFELESIINKRTEDLLSQKEKSDNLLAKVLPKETAIELMDSGKVTHQKYQMVTVLFSDIQGFTKISDQINPEALLDELDNFFQRFDTVVEKYNIEKIKTIGDAYMCAGGIPEKNSTNPIEVTLAALEMQQYLLMLNAEKTDDGSKIWDLRIGLDTGPVIAGVVGQKKLSYDIWGSTVNVASRMESSGEIGHINISANTYLLVKDYFDCKYRGKIPIKNKGTIDMYYIEGIRSELSVGGSGLKPNKQFFINLQLLRLNDLEELIFDKIENGLLEDIHFHNLNHTLSVYAIAELLGKEEGLTMEEILLVRTAALFHDTGFLISIEDHEDISVKLAKEILPEFRYSSDQIRLIERLILSTKKDFEPISVMEKVLNDADYDHYGREDYINMCEKQYMELKAQRKLLNKKAWFKDELYRLQNFKFQTRAAESYRRVNLDDQIHKLEEHITHM
jgi:class 3 adenylate cyclase/ligand-binding sensor domain-containing protein/predicted metal-dependent HD superfamily phosphohydrolase